MSIEVRASHRQNILLMFVTFDVSSLCRSRFVNELHERNILLMLVHCEVSANTLNMPFVGATDTFSFSPLG